VSSPQAVLFVCVKNAGKSQMAAGLMRAHAGDGLAVDSTGTRPGDAVNPLSAQALAEVGVVITDQTPKALTRDLVAAADLVVVLGREATVDSVAGTPVLGWELDEPSDRGIEGIDRMRLVRDDIARRVIELGEQLEVRQTG
jgi:arsenate-mycothiol transferase